MLSRIAKHWRTVLPAPSKHTVSVPCGPTQVPCLSSKVMHRSAHHKAHTTLPQLNLPQYRCVAVPQLNLPQYRCVAVPQSNLPQYRCVADKRFGCTTGFHPNEGFHTIAMEAINRYMPSGDDEVEITDKLVKVQQLLQLSETEVKILYLSLPRLQQDQLMDQFLNNIAMVQQYGCRPENESKKYGRTYRFYCFLLQTESKTLHKLLTKLSDNHANVTKISLARLVQEGKKCDTLEEYYEHIGEALSINPEVVPVYGSTQITAKIKRGTMNIYTILEKIYFLKSQGFTSAEIFDFMWILRYHIIGLNESIKKVRTEFGEPNCVLVINVLRRQTMYVGMRFKCLGPLSTLLEIPKSGLMHLNNLSIYNAVNTVEYLLEEGFSKPDIVTCPSIVGYSKCDLATELDALKQSGNEKILNDQQKIINALQYKLEKRGAKVQRYL